MLIGCTTLKAPREASETATVQSTRTIDRVCFMISLPKLETESMSLHNMNISM